MSHMVAALERWVENGVAPDEVVATKYTNDDQAQLIIRTMASTDVHSEAIMLKIDFYELG